MWRALQTMSHFAVMANILEKLRDIKVHWCVRSKILYVNGVSMSHLTPQEVAYLLGKSGNDLDEQAVPALARQLLKLLDRILPLRLSSYVILFCLLTLVPMLGFRVMQNLFGHGGSLAVGMSTAIVGVIILARNANYFFKQASDKIRQSEVVPAEILERGVVSVVGIFLMLPGPIVNLLALCVLYPPITRLVSLLVYKYLQRART